MASLTGIPPYPFQAPQPAVPKFGLFSVAPPREGIERIKFGVEIESDVCASNHAVWRSSCEEPATEDKESDPWPGFTVADSFQVYARPDCDIASSADRERARLTLARTEEFQVEQEFQALLVASVGAPETLTSAPVSVAAALGLLECFLAANYVGGVGVIHGPRSVAPFAAERSLAKFGDGMASSVLGTPWSFAGGMCASLDPDGDAADAGTAWMYATGQVFIWRGEVGIFGPEGYIDPSTNKPAVLAERTYAIGFECVAAAAQVDLTDLIDGNL